MHLLDTDPLSLVQRRDAKVSAAVLSRAGTELAVSIISVEEQLRGRLAQLHRARSGPERVRAYGQLRDTMIFYAPTRIFSFDAAAEQQYGALRRVGLRIGTQDLRIAAIALSVGAVLVTRNRRDFAQVPGLVIEDWSA